MIRKRSTHEDKELGETAAQSDTGGGDQAHGHGHSDHGQGHGHGHGHHHHEKAPSIITAFASGLICYVLMFCFSSCYGFILFYDYANKKHVGLGIKMSLVSAGVLGLIMAIFSKSRILMGGPDMNAAIFYGDMVSKMSYDLAKKLNLGAMPNKAGESRRLLSSFDAEDEAEIPWSQWFWGNEDLAIEGFIPHWSSSADLDMSFIDVPFDGEGQYSSYNAPARYLSTSSATNETEVDFYQDFCSGSHEQMYPDQCKEYQKHLRATTIILVMACNVLMGILFVALGYFHLSRYVEFVPRGIVDAFLSCMGYKVFKYALKFCKYKPTIWIPSALVGVPMYFVKAHHIGNPCITLPIFIASPIVGFYIFCNTQGYTVDSARAADLMFPEVANEDFWTIWVEAVDLQSVQWDQWRTVYPDVITMLFVLVLDSLVTGLRITGEHVPAKIHKDKELLLFGYGCFAGASCAGITGYTQLKLNMVNYGVIHNLKDRRPGLLYALLCLVTFVIPVDMINYLPRHFFGSILFFGGSGLIAEHLWGSRKYLSFTEWLQIFIIVGIFVSWDSIVYAVIVGGFLTGINFICKYARVPCIDGMPLHGGEIISRERHNALLTRCINHISNNWAVIVRLKGYCFFASVHSVVEHTRRVIDKQEEDEIPEYRRLKFVVFDCLTLDGMDASAAKDLRKFIKDTASHGLTVYWSSVNDELAKDLLKRGTVEDEDHIFYDLHLAMMHIEEKIILFRDKIQERFMKIHPKFAEVQEFFERRDNFEPFRFIFPFDAARFGCPWIYATKMRMEAKKTVLYVAGSKTADLFLIHSGSVGLFSTVHGEGEDWHPPHTIFKHGWFFNTQALIREPTSDTAICIEDGELLCWNTHAWWKMVRERPLMASAITEMVMRQTHLDVDALRSEVSLGAAVPLDEDGELDLSHLDINEDEMVTHDIPHDLQVMLDGIDAAQFLQEFKLFPKGDLHRQESVLPELPHMIADDLEIAFWTYAAPSGSEYLLPREKLEEALMFAGIFVRPLQDSEKKTMDMEQFIAFGHEKAIARLTKRQVIKIHNIFKKYDKDDSGSLEIDEMHTVFKETLSPKISEEEVVGICGAWDEDGIGTIEAKEFVGILSRFIRKHEQDLDLLIGFREILQKGRHEIIDHSCKLTPDMLMESKHYTLTREEAEEMLWACDCFDLHGDGKELDFPGFVAGVMLNVDPTTGKLPPYPKLPPKKGDKDPVTPDFGRNQNGKLQRNLTTETLGLVRGASGASLKIHGTRGKKKEQLVVPNTCRAKVHTFLEFPLSSHAAHAYSILMMLFILASCVHTALSKVLMMEADYSWCPESFPYPYYSNMEWCCASNYEKTLQNATSRSCDGSVFHADGVLSKCCRDGKQVKCKQAPCAEWKTPDPTIWDHISLGITIAFTVEYVIRLSVANAHGDESTLSFILKPLNLLELAAILPFYANLLFKTGDSGAFRLLRFARLTSAFKENHIRVPSRMQLFAPVVVVYVVIWAIYFKVTSTQQ